MIAVEVINSTNVNPRLDIVEPFVDLENEDFSLKGGEA